MIKNKSLRFCLLAGGLFVTVFTGAADARASTPAQNIQQNYVEGLRKMTVELVNVAFEYVAIIGTFFDSEQQLDTQLEIEKRTAEAHKDYHPSDTMCRFGTFVRSVARTENKAEADKLILNDVFLGNITNVSGSFGATGPFRDFKSRLKHFQKTYCHTADNNGNLGALCTYETNKAGAEDLNRVNKDIDYTRTVDQKLTLNIDMIEDTSSATEASEDEEDVYTLGRNLYWPNGLPVITKTRDAHRNAPIVSTQRELIMQAHSLTARQSIAQNSYLNILAQKASAAEGVGEESGWNFMKAMMKEFALDNDDDINKMLGDYPSYYAQMDVLAKKMYQNPNFYTNLYDKPVNVARISASMEAIKLMQLRDQYKSALRQEMLLSAMLSNRLDKPIRDQQILLQMQKLRRP